MAGAEEGHTLSPLQIHCWVMNQGHPPADLFTRQASPVSSPSGLHCCCTSASLKPLSRQGGSQHPAPLCLSSSAPPAACTGDSPCCWGPQPGGHPAWKKGLEERQIPSSCPGATLSCMVLPVSWPGSGQDQCQTPHLLRFWGEEGGLRGICSVEDCFLHKCDIPLMVWRLMPGLQ